MHGPDISVDLTKHAIERAQQRFKSLRGLPLKKVVKQVRIWYSEAEKVKGRGEDKHKIFAKHRATGAVMVSNGFRIITILDANSSGCPDFEGSVFQEALK